MFDKYSKIFDVRGHQYHQAMAEQPNVRDQEFNNIVRIADLKEGISVFDIPSGGGYLFNYIEYDTDFTQVETSKAFYDYANKNAGVDNLYCEDIAKLPIADEKIDRIISLAGLHHIEDRMPFYREAKRVLSNDGLLCIADVLEGTGADRFLNMFVDENSSEGHKGLFINQSDIQQIENAGFIVNKSEIVDYFWCFDNVENMVDYSKKMFGVNQCSDENILKGIEKYLGYKVVGGEVQMNWSLYFIQAKA